MHVKILHTILTVEFLSYIWWTNSIVYPSSSFLFWCTQNGPLASMVIRIVLLWDLVMNSWCDKEGTRKEKTQEYNFVLNFEWTDFDLSQRLLWRQRSPIQSRLEWLYTSSFLGNEWRQVGTFAITQYFHLRLPVDKMH